MPDTSTTASPGRPSPTALIALALALPGFVLARASTAPVPGSAGTVQAIEISERHIGLLPQGQEADGILGDFVLRNQYVHALVSANRPGRKANYATERGFVTPGSLYDFDVAGAGNDQLTVLRPGGIGGEVSWVRIIDDGRDGTAAVETVRTAARGAAVIEQFRDELTREIREKRLVGPEDAIGHQSLLRIERGALNSPFAERQQYLEAIPDGISVRHEYRLEPAWRHLLITSTFRNDSAERKRVPVLPIWKDFSQRWEVGAAHVGDSIDPAHRRAYAWAPIEQDATGRVSIRTHMDPEADLAPGTERTYTIAVAVADSPLAAFGVLASLAGHTGRVAGVARDRAGQPVAHATIEVEVEGQILPAYPALDGTFAFALPLGAFSARLVDVGRAPEEVRFTVTGGATQLDFAPPPASGVRMEVREAGMGLVPAVAQFVGVDGTSSPDLGPPQRARGCDDRYYSPTGQFTQQLAPGRYLVRVTRGPEYDVFEQRIDVRQGEMVELPVILTRVVDARGWVSTDFHAHSTDSGDTTTAPEDRVINLAAEDIAFAPATEHNRIGNWAPHIVRLGLQRQLATAPGIELTRSGEFHLNAFPLEPRPFVQDSGAPPWHPDPRVSALALEALFKQRSGGWIHLNHPVIGTMFNDRDADRVPDGGYAGLEHRIDGTEAWSTEILRPSAWYDRPGAGPERRENRTFGWLQLLNQGRRTWIIAVSDAHAVCGSGGVGRWRTYVKGETRDATAIDPVHIVRSSKAGRLMVTNGPFLTVSSAGGAPVGATVVSPGFIDIDVRVQAADWIDIDRVQVLVNGRADPDHSYTRITHPEMFGNGVVKFDRRIRVRLDMDAHLIVVAANEDLPLSEAWAANRDPGVRPMAYTNPIFVDVDGNGFKPNGDTLGHPLLVAPAFRQRY